jgi:hypothetical protein
MSGHFSFRGGAMRRECVSDKKILRYGEWVVQLIRGRCQMGYITPAFSHVMLEWHLGCFKQLRLVPQNILNAPYRCRVCLERVAHGDDVMSLVVGKETRTNYSVCEGRGYSLYSITHTHCAAAEER